MHPGCVKEGLQGLQSAVYFCNLKRFMRGAQIMAPTAAFAEWIALSQRPWDACAFIAHWRLALSLEHSVGGWASRIR